YQNAGRCASIGPLGRPCSTSGYVSRHVGCCRARFVHRRHIVFQECEAPPKPPTAHETRPEPHPPQSASAADPASDPPPAPKSSGAWVVSLVTPSAGLACGPS